MEANMPRPIASSSSPALTRGGLAPARAAARVERLGDAIMEGPCRGRFLRS
jgi:hypothetical protein